MIKNIVNPIANPEKYFPVGSIHTIEGAVREAGCILYEGTPVVVEEIQSARLIVSDCYGDKHEVSFSCPTEINYKQRTKLTKFEQFLVKNEALFLSPLFRFSSVFFISLLTVLCVFLEINAAKTLDITMTILFFGACMFTIGFVFLFSKSKAKVTNAKELSILLEKQKVEKV